MANEQNLIPQNKRSKKEQREIASAGGKASVEARRARKTFRLACEELLRMQIAPQQAKELVEIAQGLQESITIEQAIVLAQVKRAVSGDVSAAQFVRDTAGERPKDAVSIEQDKPFEVNIKVIE